MLDFTDDLCLMCRMHNVDVIYVCLVMMLAELTYWVLLVLVRQLTSVRYLLIEQTRGSLIKTALMDITLIGIYARVLATKLP